MVSIYFGVLTQKGCFQPIKFHGGNALPLMYLDFANICSVAKALDAKKQIPLHKESV
jgi:hypothetical protein